MARIWDELPALRGTKLIVALALADWGRDDGTKIFPSMTTLARKARISVREARRIVSEFERSAFLIREQSGRGRGNHAEWRMNLPSPEKRTETSGFEGGETGQVARENRTECASKTGQSEHNPPAHLLYDPSVRTISEPGEERDKSRQLAPASSKSDRRIAQTEWPENLKLTPEMIAVAQARGLSTEQAVDEFEAWRIFCHENDRRYRDWNSGWRMWIRNARPGAASRLSPGRQPNPYQTGASEKLKREREEIELARANETPEDRARVVKAAEEIFESERRKNRLKRLPKGMRELVVAAHEALLCERGQDICTPDAPEAETTIETEFEKTL